MVHKTETKLPKQHAILKPQAGQASEVEANAERRPKHPHGDSHLCYGAGVEAARRRNYHQGPRATTAKASPESDPRPSVATIANEPGSAPGDANHVGHAEYTQSCRRREEKKTLPTPMASWKPVKPKINKAAA
ncbi:hypothetical protein V6N12_001602 [Hibiscus sabdariffa]|uniref:Uncharacterized protein n=1 Tax=Hibiscus sabdariffa TaxID=183260 RepID=A0ABR2B895_9ROSI